MYLLPVLWFYAFFECINMAWASPEEFSSLQDSYLFQSCNSSMIQQRFFPPLGILRRHPACFLWRIYLIFSKIASELLRLHDRLRGKDFFRRRFAVPQIFFGVVIILIGIRLIVGKKKELENRD